MAYYSDYAVWHPGGYSVEQSAVWSPSQIAPETQFGEAYIPLADSALQIRSNSVARRK